MPSNLKRYQTEGNHHFITFSRYRRQPLLNNDAGCPIHAQLHRAWVG